MKLHIPILFLLVGSLNGAVITNVNVGATADDGTGDPLRTAFTKINTNFWFLTNTFSSLTDLANATNQTIPASLFPVLTGDITTPGGSLATTLKTTGTAGSYTKTTFDAQGRETSGTTLSAGDIPAIAESGVTSLVTDLSQRATTNDPRSLSFSGSNWNTGTFDLESELRATNAVGTSGQVLTSAGIGKAPYWTTPSAGGGGVTFDNTQFGSANSVTSIISGVSLTNLFLYGSVEVTNTSKASGGHFVMTNGNWGPLVYMGTNTAAFVNDAVHGTNQFHVSVPGLAPAFAIHTNGSVYVGKPTASRIATIGAGNELTNLNSIDAGTALQLSGNNLIPLSTPVLTNGYSGTVAFGAGVTNNSTAGFNGNGAGLTSLWVKQTLSGLTGSSGQASGNRFMPLTGFASSPSSTAIQCVSELPGNGYLSNMVISLTGSSTAIIAANTNLVFTVETNTITGASTPTPVDSALTISLWAGITGTISTNSGTTSVQLTGGNGQIGSLKMNSSNGVPTIAYTWTIEWWHQSP